MIKGLSWVGVPCFAFVGVPFCFSREQDYDERHGATGGEDIRYSFCGREVWLPWRPPLRHPALRMVRP